MSFDISNTKIGTKVPGEESLVPGGTMWHNVLVFFFFVHLSQNFLTCGEQIKNKIKPLFIIGLI